MAYNPSNPNGQTTSANSAPVVISSDQTSNTGTTLNTGLQEITTGGATTFHLVSVSGTNQTPIKTGVAKITGWYIYNSNGSSRKVTFYDTAGTPTAGSLTGLKFSLVIPPLSAANAPFPAGIAFTSGIGITTTTGLADSDAVGVAANDLIINIFYK